MSDDAPESIPATSLLALTPPPNASPDAVATYERMRRDKYRILFSSPLGREVLADYLGGIGFFSVDGPAEHGVANHRNGARWAGGELLRAMGADNPGALTRVILSDDIGEVFHEDET